MMKPKIIKIFHIYSTACPDKLCEHEVIEVSDEIWKELLKIFYAIKLRTTCFRGSLFHRHIYQEITTLCGNSVLNIVKISNNYIICRIKIDPEDLIDVLKYKLIEIVLKIPEKKVKKD